MTLLVLREIEKLVIKIVTDLTNLMLYSLIKIFREEKVVSLFNVKPTSFVSYFQKKKTFKTSMKVLKEPYFAICYMDN